jgi:hypothetical protein
MIVNFENVHWPGILAATARSAAGLSRCAGSLGLAAACLLLAGPAPADTAPAEVDVAPAGDIGAFPSPTPGQLGSLATGDFPPLAPHEAALSNIELTNIGDTDLGVATLQVSGDAYTLLSTDCFRAALSPGEQCTARVSFEPPDEGSYAGWLTATDSAGGNPFSLALSGAGVAVPTNTVPPGIDESRARLADGTWLLGGALLADPGSWAGYAPMRFSFKWQRCDASKQLCDEPFLGGPSYVLAREDEGCFLRVSVRARNQRGRGEPAYADTPVVKFGR